MTTENNAQTSESQTKKLVVYLFDDPGVGTWCVNSKDSLIQTLQSYIEEMDDGEDVEFGIRRRDMTQEEIDKLPEL